MPLGVIRLAQLPNFRSEQWEELTERLTLHAHYKMAGLTWRGLKLSKGGSIPKGFEPEDIAQRAILAVVEGKRACSTAQMSTFERFLEFLTGVVDSYISHLVTSAENKGSR